VRGRGPDGLRDIGEQCAIVGDDNDASLALLELRCQEFETASVEVVCGLVEE